MDQYKIHKNILCIDLKSFYALEERKRIALPQYPFEHKDYWLDPPQLVKEGNAISALGNQNLQVQLEGTENRIKIARDRYNESVKPYNVYIMKFPNSVFAGWFGFKEMPYYKADEGADKAPKVEFNF